MINKVFLIGNVGADPEVRYLKEDQPVANIRLATSERAYKRQDGSEVPERTEWHRLTVWGHSAKFAELYVKKGDMLYIEGRLHYSQYQDKNNETRYSTEIVVENLQKLSRRTDGSNEQSDVQNAPMAATVSVTPSAAEVVAEVQEQFIPDQPVDDLPF